MSECKRLTLADRMAAVPLAAWGEYVARVESIRAVVESTRPVGVQ